MLRYHSKGRREKNGGGEDGGAVQGVGREREQDSARGGFWGDVTASSRSPPSNLAGLDCIPASSTRPPLTPKPWFRAGGLLHHPLYTTQGLLSRNRVLWILVREGKGFLKAMAPFLGIERRGDKSSLSTVAS